MPTLTFPSSVYPARSSFRLEYNTQTFTSPLSRAVQSLELDGARWQVSLAFTQLTRAEAELLEAFVSQLRGMAGRFWLWDHRRATIRGAATGTPLVSGGAQVGSSLQVDGFAASTAGVLLPGDHFAVNSELKIVSAQANSDGAGLATVTFEPPLRASPANNAPITLTNASTMFGLVADDGGAANTDGPLSTLRIDAVERFT